MTIFHLKRIGWLGCGEWNGLSSTSLEFGNCALRPKTWWQTAHVHEYPAHGEQGLYCGLRSSVAIPPTLTLPHKEEGNFLNPLPLDGCLERAHR